MYSNPVSFNSTYKDVEASSVKGAILPIGSLEQHGANLPLDTDTIIASEIAREAASRLNLFLLPTIPLSCSAEHRGAKGTVYLRPETLTSVLKDIINSLREEGFKYLVVFSWHGGNFVLKPAVRYLNLDYSDFKIVLVSEQTYGDALRGIFETANDLHAGEQETSLLLHIKPDVVKGTAGSYEPSVEREMLDYLPMLKISPTGVWGDPSKADRVKGEKAFKAIVESIVKYVECMVETLNIS
ncbi:creatininase family protein [Candidatus Bathyarchaeota archaeon]|nr:creatininase family protein [Candidatus Bathyarchaeota archaeon]MBS7613394.1 creatininase family protein [Candidatus Bathyarchaeota archaeon]MBS7617975.1 creatininase family protein [Candidatus Bathyarchaeota archaeon]